MKSHPLHNIWKSALQCDALALPPSFLICSHSAEEQPRLVVSIQTQGQVLLGGGGFVCPGALEIKLGWEPTESDRQFWGSVLCLYLGFHQAALAFTGRWRDHSQLGCATRWALSFVLGLSTLLHTSSEQLDNINTL
ncbi:hypothetical protein AAFF_G00359330 [Aldrovandia affinis]|uniref:Uncharacterized protein n=1 Tax=Aldrovandia affinis TaxID=143900 RepID=A0AAD7WN43_9TELE|nr:hypothetical protein AAFF_G00359330 [Aldrovandia affinis]